MLTKGISETTRNLCTDTDLLVLLLSMRPVSFDY